MSILALFAIIISIIAISRSNEALEKIAELKKQLRGEDSSRLKKEGEPTVSSVASHEGMHHHESKKEEMYKDQASLTVHNETSHKPNQLTHQTNHDHQPYQVKNVPQEESALVKWLKDDWLLKLGGVLVIMGVLFFLSLAYEAVGPQGKIAIGYLFGISLMAFGFWYAKKQYIGGSSVHLIGAIVVMITTYVARLPDYNLFDSYVAMLLMFVTSACVALTSYAYNRPELAHVGLLMSALVPVLVSTGAPTFFEILVYLLVVILAVLWLALVTKWRSLVFMALLILCGYSLLATGGAFGNAVFGPQEIYMVALFGVLFYITSLFSIFRGAGVMEKFDALTALFNAGFALFWIIQEASKETAPIIIAFLSLAYAAGFFLVYKLTNTFTSFVVYGGVALGMLTTSIILEFSNQVTAIILLFIAAGATIYTHYLSKDENITKIIAFFNLVPFLFVLESFGNVGELSYPKYGLLDGWKDLLILFVATIVYIGLYAYFNNKIRSLKIIAISVAIFLAQFIVWFVLKLLAEEEFATGLACIINGFWFTMLIYKFAEPEITEKVALVNIIPGIFVLVAILEMVTWQDYTLSFLGLGVALFYYYFFKNRIQSISQGSLIASLTFIVFLIWQLAHVLIPSPGLATFVSILIYTVVGLYTLWKGSLENNETKIKISRIWLGFVAARVILFDAWQQGDVAVGVLICIVIGILLLSSAFIIKKATTVDKP